MSDCGCSSKSGGGFLFGGASSSSAKKFTVTSKKVKTSAGERTVYKGARGGEYVKVNGKMVSVRSLQGTASTASRSKKRARK